MDDPSYSNSAYFSDDDDVAGSQKPQESDVEDTFVCTDCSETVTRDQKGCSALKKLCVTCKNAERDILLGNNQKKASNSLRNTRLANEDRGSENEESDIEGESSSKKDKETVNLPENSTEDTVDVNSAGYFASFWSDDPSVQLVVGGEEVLFSEKKYHHGPHKCYMDLEVTSVAPLCFNYYVLAAVAMVKDKQVLYSRCWVEHKSKGDRYLLLCVLRAKCIKVRYDFLLWDKETHVIYLVCGIKKMGAYRFLPDVTVDHKEAVEVLCAYLNEPKNQLALMPGRANKDEYGNMLPLDGYDAIAVGIEGLTSKRNRKTRDLHNVEVSPTAVALKRGGKVAAKKGTTTTTTTTTKTGHKEGSSANNVSAALIDFNQLLIHIA
jgi:hypothetical protein